MVKGDADMSETLNYVKTSNDLAFTVASPPLVIASSAHLSQYFFLYCLSGALKLLFYVACLLNNIMLLPFCSQSLFSCAQHVQITRALLEVPMIPVVCIFLVLKITFCSG